MALNEVTRDEMQKAVGQLREALHSHQQWYGALTRTLVCKLPSDKRDTDPEAHKKCRFGQWYYSNGPAKLRTHTAFIAIGEAHQRMHHFARDLLIAANAGGTTPSLDFDNFANSLDRLRLAVDALERELEDTLFNHDHLTGAITRFGILPTLREQQELVKRRAEQCCVVMVDLDHFKKINDLHGHLAGDQVLAASARYLIQHLRPYDKVFRYGGEEFLLCLPYLGLANGRERAASLCEGMAAMEIDIGKGGPVHISGSFGVTLLDPLVPVESSIDRADQAMYAAKAAGRNCVRVWEPAID